MRKLSLLLIVVLCASQLAAAQLRLPGKKPSSSGGDINALIKQIDAVVADFVAASDKLLEAHLTSIEIYDSQEKKKELEQKIEQIKKIEKPDEKAKATAEVMEDMNKTLQAVTEQAIQQKKLSDQQKEDLARMSYNVALAVVKDKAVVDQARELAPKTQSAATDLGNDPQKAPQARSLNEKSVSLKAIAESGPRHITATAGIVRMLDRARRANGIPNPPEAQATGEFK
jgi:DNA-binding FrmR family transcriptional regulator